MQEVARGRIISIQEQVPSSPFERVAPKRTDITSWIAESWMKLRAKTIISGFPKAGLIGDVRNDRPDAEEVSVDAITDLRDKLSELDAAGKSVSKYDAYESDSSDEDFHNIHTFVL
ncbi:hypothetical protein ON010_g1632 [Phytophthora cinnamomi]|nr:hypothetical protein ON010_g1632 [Phytophthora cinnamomi]